MICTKCRRDYTHQTSNARDAVDFCSAECELEYKFPTMCRIADTATKLWVTVRRGIRREDAA
jgi:hypothetical protein